MKAPERKKRSKTGEESCTMGLEGEGGDDLSEVEDGMAEAAMR
jgi:hypothetical protein